MATATKRKPSRAPKRAPRPKSPARVKQRTRKPRSHHHPELWGLGMVALGLFLAVVLWFGRDGGLVGSHAASWARSVAGSAAYVLPVVLGGVGGLMLVRSALVDGAAVPRGAPVAIVGLMMTLGASHGGFVGRVLGNGLESVVGGAGRGIVGVTLVVAGTLLLTGASAGQLLRALRRRRASRRQRRPTHDRQLRVDGRPRSRAGAVATAPARDRDRPRRGRGLPGRPRRPAGAVALAARAPLDARRAVELRPPPLLASLAEAPTEEDPPLPFPRGRPSTASTAFPTATLLKPSPPVRGDNTEVSARTAQVLVQTLVALRGRRDDRRSDRRPARRALRAAAGARARRSRRSRH